MTITFTDTVITGESSIAGDIAIPANTFFVSLYGNVDFTFNVTFAKQPEGEDTFTVTQVTRTSNTFFISSSPVSNNTLQFTRIVNPFIEESFEYRMNDSEDVNTYSINQVDDRLPSFGMVRWNYPDDPKYIVVTHTFTVSGITNPMGSPFSENVSFQQYFYWKLQPSLDKFTALVSEEYF